MEIFCGNSQRVKAAGCFRRGALELMFDRILNAALSEEKVSTTGVIQGYLELPLPPNSLDSHQTQKQQEAKGFEPALSIQHECAFCDVKLKLKNIKSRLLQYYISNLCPDLYFVCCTSFNRQLIENKSVY